MRHAPRRPECSPPCRPARVAAVVGVPLLLTLVGVPAPGGAQPASGDSLTLAAVLARLRDGTPGVRVAEGRRDQAAGRAGELGQFTNPTFEWRRENLRSPLQPDIFATFYVPFDVTGRRLQLRSAAGAGRARATAQYAAERRAADLEAARAWLQAAYATERERVLRAQAEALRELARVDSARFQEGAVAEGVAMRTRLEADRGAVALAHGVAEASRARAALAAVLGVSDDRLPPLAALSAPGLPEPPDSAAVRRVAVAQRPEVTVAEQAVREASARASAEARGVLGEWQLQTGTKETGGFMTGQLGVALPLPLFNRNGGARQRARGELAEARALRDLARVGVVAEADAARAAYAVFRATAGDAATFGARGLEIATIARVAYREGQATLVELLDAERASVDARTAHLQWMVDAWRLRLDLETAIGARLGDDSPLALPLLATLLPGTPR